MSFLLTWCSYALLEAVLGHPASESALRGVYHVLSTAYTNTTAGATTSTSTGSDASNTVNSSGSSVAPADISDSGVTSSAGGDASAAVAGDVGYDYLQPLSREETIKVLVLFILYIKILREC